MDFCLDTNIVIGLFANDKSIVSNLGEVTGKLVIPSIVVEEPLYGAEASTQKDVNKKKIFEFVQAISVVNCTKVTAEYYAGIKSELKKKGNPIPENDIWIAALAQEYKLTLITRDNHFNSIDNLVLSRW